MTTKSVVNVIQQGKADLLAIVQRDPSCAEPVLSKLVDAYMGESLTSKREVLFDKLSYLIEKSSKVASIVLSKAEYAGINDSKGRTVLGIIAVEKHPHEAAEMMRNGSRDISRIRPRKGYESIEERAIKTVFHS
ncbi:MAG TPA: hypothetical protein VMV00_00770 [Candidatus Baltobacteraceae bacterium]|nr:hypothetical protein [Candidatus Baltobacteraceae bacterium]